MKIRFVFAWYDFWIGVYWDRRAWRLFILPVPCLGIMLDFVRADGTRGPHNDRKANP